jgi:hypothetical protein
MPLEEDAERGNVLVDDMGKAHAFRDHTAAVEELGRDPERYSVATFISHHAVCPEGEAWRAKRAAKPKPPKPAAAPAAPEQGSLL